MSDALIGTHPGAHRVDVGLHGAHPAGAHGAETHHRALQHQFESMSQQKEAGVLGMWVFLLTEVLFFGGVFFAYMLYRIWYFDAFAEASRTLDLYLGGFNTAVLIGSSLTMAFAVRSAQVNRPKATMNWIFATIVLGAVFLGVKVVEYEHKFTEHHVPGPSFVWEEGGHSGAQAQGVASDEHSDATPGTMSSAEAAGPVHVPTVSEQEMQRRTQIFFSLYFLMTGLHAIHMIVGIVILFVIAWMAYRNSFDEHWYAPVEMTGLYWHFVDIVWIFLFPLLYLVERHT